MHTLTVDELLDKENHAWEEVRNILKEGQNPYSIISAESESALGDTLYRLQVSTKSYLGTVAYETGGIVFDHGWITLLGAGGSGIYGSLTSWNGLQEPASVPALWGMLIVAYDAAGGFFGLNTGRFGNDGQIYYFAPDTLAWEPTEKAYSGFFRWLAEGDLELFYQTFRWKGWQDDVRKLQPGQVFAYYPSLWTKEGSGETSRKAPIAVAEAWEAARDEE
ncbi:DUF2625 domain-containing protein [Paenibacillus sp. 23TSA30-6]|uniref:DUF2625 domain-containing protein n=1 Tax=Paenibacillus sp. 23TSA30-6 TaxID=2546104 RepID=UPI001787D00B|nr:DUF2625 domain-containing protein [Paenibacillus sp. 23TSA30-6]MBE0337083.1 DUF2625 domain-containing protein [Paenibacillus sp. 23TSA30-6]